MAYVAIWNSRCKISAEKRHGNSSLSDTTFFVMALSSSSKGPALLPEHVLEDLEERYAAALLPGPIAPKLTPPRGLSLLGQQIEKCPNQRGVDEHLRGLPPGRAMPREACTAIHRKVRAQPCFALHGS